VRQANGRVIKLVRRDRHRCSPPGWRERRTLSIDFGSVWECGVCQTQWKWDYNYAGAGWSQT